MKKVLMMLFVMSLAVGCVGTSINLENDATTNALISIAVRNVSCELAMVGDPELIETIENIYDSIKLGSLTDEALSQIAELTTDRPTLAADIEDIVALLGVKFDLETGDVLGIGEIAPETWKAVERAWGQGQSMCK